MIGLRFHFEDMLKRVANSTDEAAFRNVGHAAAKLRKEAVESIEPGDGPSPPGQPPHTHTQRVTKKGKVRKGQLPRAIAYNVDKQKQSAVIGPRYSVVGIGAEAHEFGGEHLGDSFDKRPFMGPAMDSISSRFASDMAGTIGP